MGSKNELWGVKNEIGDENMKKEDGEESMKNESQKAMEASNVKKNVAKWKIDFTLLGKPEESEAHISIKWKI